ncbi:MAG: hypothetical protein ACTSPQ_09090 [Candidatus Helarchaeota archaeon]
MSSIEKNSKIIKEELVTQMNIGLGNVSRLIGRMFGNGVTGFFLNPVAKLIYNIMLSDDIKKKTKNQIDIILECANLYHLGLNGGSIDYRNTPKSEKERVLNEIIDKYFEVYRKNDQSFHHCKKSHKIYPEIERIMKEVFKSRIEPAKQLLTSTGETYDELTRNAFTKEEAIANVDREFRATEDLLALLKKHMDVMDVPSFVRKKIVKIMIDALELTKKQIYGRIDEIYSNYS